MSNNAFDRTILNARERPMSSDINQAQSQLDRTLRDVLREVYTRRTALDGSTWAAMPSGFIGQGFLVRPTAPAGMSIRIAPGFGLIDAPADVPVAIGGVSGLDDRATSKPVALSAEQTIAVPAADPANPRIDIVEIMPYRRAENPLARDVLDIGTGIFAPNVVNKTLAFNLDGLTSVNGAAAINYKTGIAAGAPAAPATTAGYTRIAAVYVPAAAASIATDRYVRDERYLLAPGGIHRASCHVTSQVAANVVTMNNLVAPPGVRVSAGNPGMAFTSCEVYVVVPGPAAPTWATAVVTVESLAGGALTLVGTPAAVNIGSVTTTEAGYMAVGSPAINVSPLAAGAANMPCFRIRVMVNAYEITVGGPVIRAPTVNGSYRIIVEWGY